MSAGSNRPYADPNHPGNSPAHHTGKRCIEPGCGNSAGTGWSHLWCMGCNVKRMDGINASLQFMAEAIRSKKGKP